MDTTYGVNDLNMHLTTLMVEDADGHGQEVAFCVVKQETTDLLTKFLLTFKEINKEVLERNKVFWVDKNTREKGAIDTVMPHPAIHLCVFHILQALKRKLNTVVCGKECRVEVVKLLQNII